MKIHRGRTTGIGSHSRSAWRVTGNAVCRLTLAAILALPAGCSVYMAAHQPDKKDLSLLTPGTPRPVLLKEFGKPADSRMVDGRREDFFMFTQGYSSGVKTSRAVFHGAADVLTLGLWEIVGTPTEATFDGTKMAVDVKYDKNNQVEQVRYLRHKPGAQ